MDRDRRAEREDLLEHYRQMHAELLAAIEGLSDDQMAARVIDGWSVADHLSHLALWDEIRAGEVTRISAGQDSAWMMSAEQDEDFNRIGYDLRREHSAAQARWEVEESNRRLLEALAVATERGLDASLYGEAGLRSAHKRQHAAWLREWRSRPSV